jgi:hypothetical protein
MDTPELKQFGQLTPQDFDHHPVWIAVHTADYGEPRYEDTDEETFRPWTGALPVGASNGIFLVKATLRLRDGSSHAGFVTPARNRADLGVQQPHIFAGGRVFGFWGGMFGIRMEERQSLYASLTRTPEAIFPLSFSVDPALATDETSGEVGGFYRCSSLNDPTPQIEL